MTCVVPNRALDTWKKKVLSGMLKYRMDPQMYPFKSTVAEAESEAIESESPDIHLD